MASGAGAVQAEGRRLHRGVAEVLRELSVPAADALVDNLGQYCCLSAARLVCRALRDAVDGSIRELSLTVRASDRQRTLDGKLPSLKRWPRCTFVSVELAADDYYPDDTYATALMALPFTSTAHDARARITRLALVHNDDGISRAESVVAMLVHRLRGLREVQLHELVGMTYKRMHQQVMYDSLATLPHLERLTLPDCRALKCVGALGAAAASGGLTHLTVQDALGSLGRGLGVKAVAGLAQLSTLRELRFVDCNLYDRASGFWVALRQMLGCLPPPLEQLHLDGCWSEPNSSPLHAVFTLSPGRSPRPSLVPGLVPGGGGSGGGSGGAVTVAAAAIASSGGGASRACELDFGYDPENDTALHWIQLVELAGEVLLPVFGPTEGLQLHRLRAVMLTVEGVEPLLEEDAEKLRALQRCCPQVEVHAMILAPGVTLPVALQAVALLARPERLYVKLPVYGSCSTCRMVLSLDTVATGTKVAAVATATADGHNTSNGNRAGVVSPPPPAIGLGCLQVAPAAPSDSLTALTGPPLPTVAQLTHTVLSRLVAGAAGQTALPPPPAEPAAAKLAAWSAPPAPGVSDIANDSGTSAILTDGVDMGSGDEAVARAAPSAAAAGGSSIDASDVLLLRGAFMALLVQGKALLNGWMNLLEERAAARVGAAGGSDGDKCIVSYQSFPSAAAVVVVCRKDRGPAVTAAAAALVEAAGAAASLEICRVAVAPPMMPEVKSCWRSSWQACAMSIFMASFEQAVREVWDGLAEPTSGGVDGGGAGGNGGGGGGGNGGGNVGAGIRLGGTSCDFNAGGRLEWLLGLRDDLKALPSVVRL